MIHNISVAELDAELNKFSILCSETEECLPMFSNLIDARWHKLLSSSNIKLPTHDPTVRSNGPEQINWIKDYERKFGRLNICWFINGNGYIDSISYNAYIKSGCVCAEYNCVGRIYKNN